MEKFSFTNREDLDAYFNNLSQNNPVLFNFLINENLVIDVNIISAFILACENFKLNVFQPPSLVDMQVELTIGLEKEKVSFNLSSIHHKVDDLWEASGFRSNKSIPIQENNVNENKIEEKNNVKQIEYINKSSNTENGKDSLLVFLFGFAFLWVLGSSGVLSILRYLINPEIPAWIIYAFLFFGFVVVWKIYFEKK